MDMLHVLIIHHLTYSKNEIQTIISNKLDYQYTQNTTTVYMFETTMLCMQYMLRLSYMWYLPDHPGDSRKWAIKFF